MWGDLFTIASRLNEILQQEPSDVCDNLGELYALFLSAGHYLDTDYRIQKDRLTADDPLDPQLHRLLSNLVSLSAPWLRGFPTVAAWDTAAGRALPRGELFQPVQAFNQIALSQNAISERDASEIAMLGKASGTEEPQERKAAARAIGDIKNLMLTSAETVIKSDAETASQPLHVRRAIAALKLGRDQVEKVAESLQPDLRHALRQIIYDLAKNLSR